MKHEDEPVNDYKNRMKEYLSKFIQNELALDEKAKRDYKDEYKKFQSSTKAKKYRAELNKYNRQKGTYGNGDGKDASHKGGKIVGFESQSKNRGRAEKSRLKREDVKNFLRKSLNESGGCLCEACWKGYEKKGMKKMFGKMYPNCVKKTKKEDIGDKFVKQRMNMLRRFFDQNHGRVKNAVERDARTGSNEFRNTDNRGEKYKLTVVINRLKELRNKLQKKDRGLADFFTKNIKVIEKTKDKMKESVSEGKLETLALNLLRNINKEAGVKKYDHTKTADFNKVVKFLKGKMPRVPNKRIGQIAMSYDDYRKKQPKIKIPDIDSVKDMEKTLKKLGMKEGREASIIQHHQRQLDALIQQYPDSYSRPYPIQTKIETLRNIIAVNRKKMGESVNEVNMAHVYSKDLSKKKFKDLGLYLAHVLDLSPRYDFKLTSNKKLLAINIDKINPKSLQNIKKRFGIDLKKKAKEPIRLKSKSGMGKISHLGIESVNEYTYGVGDIVKDINPTCPHNGAMGKVKSISPKSVVFVVMNKGKNYQPGDVLDKTHDQMKKMNEISNSEAKELLRQLGGRRFMMMVGAKGIARDKDGLHMKIGRNSKSISHVVIDYNRGRDLYDMKFLRVRSSKGKMNVKVVKQVKGIYADQLHDTFEKHTGLYTRM